MLHTYEALAAILHLGICWGITLIREPKTTKTLVS